MGRRKRSQDKQALLEINNLIAEVRLLEKYKDLVFYDPDNECVYTVWKKIWSGSVDATVSGA